MPLPSNLAATPDPRTDGLAPGATFVVAGLGDAADDILGLEIQDAAGKLVRRFDGPALLLNDTTLLTAINTGNQRIEAHSGYRIVLKGRDGLKDLVVPPPAGQP